MNKEPAFPIPATEYHGMDSGMTLRDYFAAKALSALPFDHESSDRSYDNAMNESAAKRAYRIADAMLKARE